ncbi:MAG TPA: N-acetylmuramoyl-L-alanine amidase [Chitinophagales bacterium]|nr:N-acetylmuramoyl-L-alanine amidase [Chitinophagales bacterium]
MIRTFILLLFCVASCSFCLSAQPSGYKIKTIVLDAGHGGHDSGCRGAFSNEKDVTLSVVLKLGALIKQTYPDIKVIYTRATDEFIELYERADIANRNDADLFISIHCNANRSHEPYGTETWLMGLKKSEGNLEVSKRENEVVLMESDYQQHYDGFDPNSPEGYIILTMNQNAHMTQSIDLASKVEDQFKHEGRTSRGVKQAGFLVLWRTTMPSILIETGFLTNRTEEKYLNSETGQNEIANGVLNAITDYRNAVEGGNENENKSESEGLQNNRVVVKNSDSVQISSTKISNVDSQNINVADSSPSLTLSPTSEQLIYRIQIAASSKPLDLRSPPFSSFKEVKNDKSETGINRYMVGNYMNYEECVKALADIRKKGIKDAFIVGYKLERRVLTKYAQ